MSPLENDLSAFMERFAWNQIHSPLLRLPAELRIKIYAHVNETAIITHDGHWEQREAIDSGMHLRKVCTQLRMEARRTTPFAAISLRRFVQIKTLVDVLGGEQCAMITAIEFDRPTIAELARILDDSENLRRSRRYDWTDRTLAGATFASLKSVIVLQPACGSTLKLCKLLAVCFNKEKVRVNFCRPTSTVV